MSHQVANTIKEVNKASYTFCDCVSKVDFIHLKSEMTTDLTKQKDTVSRQASHTGASLRGHRLTAVPLNV